MIDKKVRFKKDGKEYEGKVRDAVLVSCSGTSETRYLIEGENGRITLADPRDVIAIIRTEPGQCY